MEIVRISKTALRIKGKNAVLVVDPSEKTESNAALLLQLKQEGVNTTGSEIVISGPGEYETGGVKITGVRNESELVYSMDVDPVGILLGRLTTFEKLHNKLKEVNIVVVNCDKVTDASFLSALTTNVIIFYGEKAIEIGREFGQENVKHLPKYATTIDKLPAEVETVILE